MAVQIAGFAVQTAVPIASSIDAARTDAAISCNDLAICYVRDLASMLVFVYIRLADVT